MNRESKTMWVCIVPLAYDIMSLAGDERTATKLALRKAVEFLTESKSPLFDGMAALPPRYREDCVASYFGTRTYEIKPETAIVCS